MNLNMPHNLGFHKYISFSKTHILFIQLSVKLKSNALKKYGTVYLYNRQRITFGLNKIDKKMLRNIPIHYSLNSDVQHKSVIIFIYLEKTHIFTK